ncbi:MAG: hypothetical protein LBM66_07570 [Bifidobacteriaceae bacterium]|jgi:predicted transcriptional regulator|nr:hypothetical protein [Bifidobacteriaceae bacterium]
MAQITVRLDPVTARALDSLMAHTGGERSATVRAAIRETEYQRALAAAGAPDPMLARLDAIPDPAAPPAYPHWEDLGFV